MTTEITLESLGLNKEELTKRLIDTLATRLLESTGFGEDGEYTNDSRLAVELQKQVKASMEARIAAIGEAHILPIVSSMVDNLVLQETNKWGEKRGEPLTFVEYMIHRAEKYITEEVDYNGKTQSEHGYGWSKKSTRIVHMIHQHLHLQIEAAMKEAMKSANSAIVKGIEGAVKLALGQTLEKLKVGVSV